MKELEDKPLAEYFEGTVAKHVYYISGFLCRAGEKEKERRSKNNDVGTCIGAVSRHFVTKASEIEAVKRDLPDNLADLIDRRSCYGVLKYPNLQFYTLVARLEYCYSKLVTSQNISKFGGIVLACICDEMVRYLVFVDQFDSLFHDSEFCDATIDEAFRFYVKVFSNLRVKDLCRKYNAQLSKTTTVGLRQTLATKKSNKKSKQIAKRKRSTTSAVVTITPEDVHNQLADIADDGITTAAQDEYNRE